MSDYLATEAIKLSRLESAIGIFFPRFAERIIRNKTAIQCLDAAFRSQYKAAEATRHNANWSVTDADINNTLAQELPKMRRRARWLVRNNPLAKSALNSFQNYCISTGFDLQMQATRIETMPNGDVRITERDEYNDFVEDVFRTWSKNVMIDASESCPDTFQDFQNMAFTRLVEDGELFVHMMPDRTNMLYLNVIEPEALDTTKTSNGVNPVLMGVEIDANTWRPVAYWVTVQKAQYSGYVYKGDSVRIPAAEMAHCFVKRYPRQIRGIPWFHAVSERLFQLDEYQGALLLRSKIAALFAVIFKGGEGTGLRGFGTSAETASAMPKDVNGNPISQLAPGMLGSVGKGIEPHIINPSSPETAYNDYVRNMAMNIAAGMEFGMSYKTMTRDTSQTTFASGRDASLMDFQAFRPIQRFFASKVLSPIFRRWFDMAVMTGAVAAPGYELQPDAWRAHSWLPGGWTWGINPVQEVTASEKSMAARITSLADECALLGLDWKIQLRKTAKVEKYAKEIGVTLPGMADDSDSETDNDTSDDLDNEQTIEQPT